MALCVLLSNLSILPRISLFKSQFTFRFDTGVIPDQFVTFCPAASRDSRLVFNSAVSNADFSGLASSSPPLVFCRLEEDDGPRSSTTSVVVVAAVAADVASSEASLGT
eukprot:CAMPEP_0181140540 /NCGR_PEP_ID=MMETSP1071-20121207/35357_1 /TAXON_ID=35127 /ORGANISM="Thalassiosira sp., Strain NH16" /LENGTH=107 /DNA_ID=CAMNT_0023227495 /DNA_START=195 /DNA_END=518 /DNA_ORIENTATION=+